MVVTVVFLLAGAQVSTASPGDLDPSFGVEGQITTPLGYSRINGLTLQEDAKLMAVGVSLRLTGDWSFALARYGPGGSLDPAFGDGGVVEEAFGRSSIAYASAIQRDGKIVVVGTVGPKASPFDDGSGNALMIARYRADGTLDGSFGSGGNVRTDTGRTHAGALSVAIEPDGDIIVAGFSGRDGFLTRYQSDGSLDASFGQGGSIRTRYLGRQRAGSFGGLAIQGDGRIVAVGTACGPHSRCSIVVARFGSDGAVDPTFASDGRALVPFRDTRSRGDVLIQPDGKIVVAAGRYVLRFDVDGLPDPAFGVEGAVRGPVLAFGIGLQRDGSVVVGGDRGYQPYSFMVARYTAEGALDRSFGQDGLAVASFDGFNNVAFDVIVQGDDRIVLGGTTSDTNVDANFALARFLAA